MYKNFIMMIQSECDKDTSRSVIGNQNKNTTKDTTQWTRYGSMEN